jgi:hypothetical protein
MKLHGALKGLICEIASLDSIVDAIKNRKIIIINYNGDVSKSGNKVLRAWDSEGASHTSYNGEQPLPGWRLFRLDKILSNKPTGEVYNEPKPGYNFNGDKSMISVIINATFNDDSLIQ